MAAVPQSGNAEFNPALLVVKRLIRHQPESQLLGVERQRPILVGDGNAGKLYSSNHVVVASGRLLKESGSRHKIAMV